MNHKLLVIIVTYNGMQWLDKCIHSVINSTVNADIFIVDNLSTDGTQKYIKDTYPNIIFKESDINLGFGKANNLGFKYAIDNNYDYVYLLNQDAWVFPSTFETLIAIAEKNKEYGILSPFQMQANMSNLDLNFLKFVCCYESNPNIFNDCYNKCERDVYEVPDVMAAHWLISKQCFSKVGGFSKSFPHYGEDNNYANRTLFYGFKIGIVPSCKAVHDRELRNDPPKKKMYLNYINAVVSVSNPLSTKTHYYAIVKSFVKQAIEYHSIRPFQFLSKFIWNLNFIYKNKKLSEKTDCAFLINE